MSGLAGKEGERGEREKRKEGEGATGENSSVINQAANKGKYRTFVVVDEDLYVFVRVNVNVCDVDDLSFNLSFDRQEKTRSHRPSLLVDDLSSGLEVKSPGRTTEEKKNEKTLVATCRS